MAKLFLKDWSEMVRLTSQRYQILLETCSYKKKEEEETKELKRGSYDKNRQNKNNSNLQRQQKNNGMSAEIVRESILSTEQWCRL